MTADTQHLIQRALEGDESARETIFGRHRGRLLAFAVARLPAAAERVAGPEDIVQETLLEASRKLGSFEPQGPASFYRWLVGIARFKISEAVRAAGAKKRALQAPLQAEPLAKQTSPSGRVMHGERSAALRAGLDGIPETQAEAVRLRYLEGLTVAECAERLETTPSAVKALVSRGLTALAARITRPS